MAGFLKNAVTNAFKLSFIIGIIIKSPNELLHLLLYFIHKRLKVRFVIDLIQLNDPLDKIKCIFTSFMKIISELSYIFCSQTVSFSISNFCNKTIIDFLYTFFAQLIIMEKL